MARKQNNFYSRWYEAQRAGKAAARRTLLLWLLPAVLIVTACLAALAVVLVQTYGFRTRSDSLLGWCYDEPNYTPYTRSVIVMVRFMGRPPVRQPGPARRARPVCRSYGWCSCRSGCCNRYTVPC